MVQIESGALTFDPVTHTYLVDGVVRWSVTGILSDAGVIDKRFFNTHAARRGSAIHEAIRLMLQNKLDSDTLDPRIIGYLEAAKKAIHELRIKPEDIEIPLYHDEFDYCGTPDLIGTKEGKYILLDWKSGAEAAEYERLQSIMYQMAWEFKYSAMGLKISKRMIVHLKPNFSYKVTTYLDHVKDTNDAIYLIKGGVYGNRNA